MSLSARLDEVRARIRAAALRAGRRPEEIRLVAVTKGHPASVVRAARDVGCLDLGENYPQEMLKKMEAVPDPELRWHLIGPLQRNKARHVVGRVELIHTVDSARLAQELEKRAADRGITIEVLCQVNVAGEEQKHGVAPQEAERLLEAIAEQDHVRARGLMTIPPLEDDPERSRPHFRALRELRDRLHQRGGDDLAELSMGMSHDFEVAIEEGATMVRVGTALFGERPPRDTRTGERA